MSADPVRRGKVLGTVSGVGLAACTNAHSPSTDAPLARRTLLDDSAITTAVVILIARRRQKCRHGKQSLLATDGGCGAQAPSTAGAADAALVRRYTEMAEETVALGLDLDFLQQTATWFNLGVWSRRAWWYHCADHWSAPPANSISCRTPSNHRPTTPMAKALCSFCSGAAAVRCSEAAGGAAGGMLPTGRRRGGQGSHRRPAPTPPWMQGWWRHRTPVPSDPPPASCCCCFDPCLYCSSCSR